MILESEHRAIVDTLVRYCTAVDNRTWELLGDVFLPNARVDYSGVDGPVLSGAEAGRWLEESTSRYKVQQHFLSNVRVSHEGDGVRSRAYVLAVHGYLGIDGKMRFFDLGAEYNDRLVETSAGWRISERVLSKRWKRGDVPKG